MNPVTSILAALVAGVPIAKMDTSSNTEFLNLDLIFDLPSDFLMGYVAGRIGKNHPIPNSIIAGAVWLVFNFLLYFISNMHDPIWYSATIMLTMIPTAYLGGLIAAKKGDSSNKKGKKHIKVEMQGNQEGNFKWLPRQKDHPLYNNLSPRTGCRFS